MIPVGGNVAVCAGNRAAPSIRLKRVTSGIVKDGIRACAEKFYSDS
jgi:hypothetical protein